MPISSSGYFINGPTLLTATSVFTDSGMTIYAVDGFYSDGTSVREQLGGVLQSPTSCPSCLAWNCQNPEFSFNSSSLPGGHIPGMYKMKFSSTNSGAVYVLVNTSGDTAIGVRATYNGQVYNRLSNNGGAPYEDGYLAQPDPNAPVWIGRTNCCLVPESGCGNPDPYVQPLTKIYQYNPALNVFVDTGTNTVMTVNSSQLDLLTSGINNAVLIIPKPPVPSAPTDFELEIWTLNSQPDCGFIPDWSVYVYCPTPLLSARRTSVSANETIACGKTPNIPYWYAKVSGGVPTDLFYNDWVFGDVNGVNVLADGYYRANNLTSPTEDLWFRVENGRVVEIDACP